MKFYIFLFLLSFILLFGCNTSNTDSPEKKDLGPDGRFVGTWIVGKSEFKADSGGIWYPDDPINKIALKPDKTWEDDKGNKGTWAIATIEESDWTAWGVSWDTSTGKPEKKIVLTGMKTVSGFIEEGQKTDFFWLFFRFQGDGETPEGWIQFRLEKISDIPKIEKSSNPPASNSSKDPELAKTKVVPDLESRLLGEYGFGTSRKLVLKYGGKWELIPEVGGSSGTWELKDVTRKDIDKWIEDGDFSDASEILSKKLVLHNRRCSYDKPPETEEIYLYVADEQRAFTSCGISWFKRYA